MTELEPACPPAVESLAAKKGGNSEYSVISEGKVRKWEPPVEFDGFDLPAFPEEALPKVLRDYVGELAAP